MRPSHPIARRSASIPGRAASAPPRGARGHPEETRSPPAQGGGTGPEEGHARPPPPRDAREHEGPGRCPRRRRAHPRGDAAPGCVFRPRPSGLDPLDEGRRLAGLVRAGARVRRHPQAGPRQQPGGWTRVHARTRGQGMQPPPLRRHRGTPRGDRPRSSRGGSRERRRVPGFLPAVPRHGGIPRRALRGSRGRPRRGNRPSPRQRPI